MIRSPFVLERQLVKEIPMHNKGIVCDVWATL